MKALLYLIKKTLKNLVKGIFKKPSALIGFIFIFAFVVFIIVASFLMPSGIIRSASNELFNGIIMLVFTVLYFSYLRVGIEKGSTYFRMADVNLVFTAPIEPRNILLYGFIKQIGGTIILLFFTFCQIPNLRNNFEFQPYGVWMLLAAVVALALAYPLIGMLIYSWISKNSKRKKLVNYIFYIFAAIIVVIALLDLLKTKNVGTTLANVFDNPVAKYFPIIGWTGSIATAAVSGITTEVYVGAIGMVLLVFGISVALYRMNLDFYEDVLEGTEYIEAAVKAKREGNTISFNTKIKSKTKNKLLGKGASAIFSKQFLEYRRTSHFFLFDRTSIIIILSAIMFRVVSPNIEMDTDATLFYILGFAVYMLLLVQGQGRLNLEIEKPFIYLIPDNPFKKLFYATIPEHLKNFFDGLLLFVIAGFMLKAGSISVLACIAGYVAMGSIFVYTGVLTRRIFGSVQSKNLIFFLKIICSIIFLFPGILAAAIVGVITESWFIAICVLGGWSLIFAITFFVFSSGILNNIEAAG
ncbi:MAG: hypothetical protein GX957_09320 [Clostridiaceae bacterium]|nr:hypothetical protein [Clostridiaceae bacterium]